jgi:hypothetical protein
MRVFAIVCLSWWYLIDPVNLGNYLGYLSLLYIFGGSRQRT